jgi:mRNA interferase HicA
MSDSCLVNGSEFIRKIKKLGKARGVAVELDESRGKGSHVTLYFGQAFTVVRNRKDELKTGTLLAMLAQLGLTKDDLR